MHGSILLRSRCSASRPWSLPTAPAPRRRLLGLALVVGAGFGHLMGLRAAESHGLTEGRGAVRIAEASDEGRQAIRKFRVPKGWKVDLIAAEPDLANPVAFTFDEKERIYVVETFRHSDGVLDIRGRAGWPSPGFQRGLSPERRARLPDETLDADLACRTVEDRIHMLRMYFAENAPSLERFSERVRQIRRGSDGRSAGSTVFADGFQALEGGLASGVLARGGDVWFTDIPHLWRLRDRNGDGRADERTSLSRGYGVRVGFLGHDLHGLRLGPDGRLYFTVGDRGADVVTREGRRWSVPDTGAVFRCDPDGANLELYATGLRNPQELVFDALGNLWTGDNNSDGGDQARWVQIVEGGDSGWHIGWQFIESPNPRGPWNAEGMWRPEAASDIGYLVPPLKNIGAGPSGITVNPGTGLPPTLDGKFFMTDFRGGPSGIWAFGVEPKGAGYAVTGLEELLWNALPTDVEAGPDGGLYWTDWVQGWEKPGKGRIYRMYDPDVVAQATVKETRRLLGGGMAGLNARELGSLLGHRDARVRLEAQFALVARGAARVLTTAARGDGTRNLYGRLHGLWGLGQIARREKSAAAAVAKFLEDPEPEMRGQAARILGDVGHAKAAPALVRLLGDPRPRPRFFAAMALGRLGHQEAGSALVSMLRANADRDPYLRHAGVMGLAGTRTSDELAALAEDSSAAVRRAAVVALRRQQSPLLGRFVGDADPAVQLEAARAINDLPVTDALPSLAGLIRRSSMPTPLARRVLNATFRVGHPLGAGELAAFAADVGQPESLRAEALAQLGRWAEPPGRDGVTGLWRPLAKRDPAPARAALETGFGRFLSGPESVRLAAVHAAGTLGARTRASDLRSIASDAPAGPAVRQAALRVLADWRDDQLASMLETLGADRDEAVRSEAVRLQTRLGAGNALGSVRAALARGSTREQQAALAGLASVRGPEADELLVEWLQRAAQGRVPVELELELKEAAQGRDAGPVKSALAGYETSLASTNVVQSRRSMLRGGDAAAGRQVFHGKESVQCIRCHKAGAEGGVVGPDLVDVGARLSREQILESIVHPSAVVAKGFENVMVELKDGTELAGTVQKETAAELALATPDAGLVTVRKSDIADRRSGLSGMPEGLADLVTPRELRDLIEFLAGLRGAR